MSKFIRNTLTLSALFIFLLSSCNLPSSAPNTEEPNAIYTQAALTLQAQLNQAATPVQFNTPTLPPPQPSNTAVSLPTLPSATSTPLVSATPVCDQATFLKDVNYLDGTLVAPGETFKKTWRLKNTGTCTWSGYILIFDNGEGMNPTPDPIPTVTPGQEVDISVTFTAPTEQKSYKSYWRLRNASGVLLPVVGGYQGTSFFVDIKVGVFSAGYDFYTRASSAVWITGAGNITFGGPDSNVSGFAMYKDGQRWEDGTIPSTKVLETHPQFVDNGVISGRFPAYTVVTGEHFTAKIGFLATSGACGAGNAKFQLNYKEGGGSVTPLGEWTETCDGTIRSIDVDLTPLKGKTVEFILAILANGPHTDDSAVWLKPQIALP